MTLGRTSDNKLKIKTDGEAGLRAVSCACCTPGLSCGECPVLEDAIEATSITIGGTISDGQYFTFNLTSQSVSIVEPFAPVEYSTQDLDAEVAGTASGSLCGAANSVSYNWGASYVNVGVSFTITKGAEECEFSIGASYVFGGPADYGANGSGGITVAQANLMGTHSFAFPVTGCRQIEVGYDEEMGMPIYETQCNTSNYSAVITIS
jgi:hypothetical protein